MVYLFTCYDKNGNYFPVVCSFYNDDIIETLEEEDLSIQLVEWIDTHGHDFLHMMN